MNSAEQNYAQIEKELLAIVFGLVKFHEYVYGKVVDIETDHKPLESLYKKPLSNAPPRLQRMMLRIQKYDLRVKYSPGETLHIADTLSRAALRNDESEDDFEVHILENKPITCENVERFQSETAKDEILGKLMKTVINGWPESKQKLDSDLSPYWNIRDDINIYDGLLFKGERIITPLSLGPEMLKRIHLSHMGIEKSLSRAREVLYWPGMSHKLKTLSNNVKFAIDTDINKQNNHSYSMKCLTDHGKTLPLIYST